MHPSDKLFQILKNHGYSLTKPRSALFEILLHTQEALTVSEIIERSPTIDAATVYRTLDMFEKVHVVQRVWNGFKSKIELSEAFSPHHHHFTCLNCGLACAIENEQLESSLHALEAVYGFDLQQHSVELSGYCERCVNEKQTA